MFELLIVLIVIGLTFAAGAKYGRTTEQAVIAKITSVDVNAIASIRARVEKYL